MKIISFVKRNKILTSVMLVYAVVFLIMPSKAIESVNNSIFYIVEMLQIMPVIFILTAIIEAWVPKEVIINGFGEKSGSKGIILSFALGSLSAGPIYAAFPISKALLKKGASITNIVIILSSWAVIKVPMLANEAKFLGLRFMIVRWILTTISIIIMAYLISKLVKRHNMPMEVLDESQDYKEVIVQGQYCIGCGICAKISPEVFEIINRKARVKTNFNGSKDISNIKKAIEKCPSRIITF